LVTKASVAILSHCLNQYHQYICAVLKPFALIQIQLNILLEAIKFSAFLHAEKLERSLGALCKVPNLLAIANSTAVDNILSQ
jgi:hypothetical protein